LSYNKSSPGKFIGKIRWTFLLYWTWSFNCGIN